MKKYLLFLIVPAFFLSACEKRLLDFASTYSESGTYTVNQTGPFSETVTFNAQETLDALDLPEDLVIDSLFIQNITLKGTTQTGNTATGVNIQGTVTYAGQTLHLFNSNSIAINNNGVTELALTSLNPTAVRLLKNFFTAEIYDYLGIPYPGFNHTDRFFTISVSGSPTPGPSAQLNLNLELTISFDFSYSGCFDVVSFMGEDCP
jgi:hypothetical protein